MEAERGDSSLAVSSPAWLRHYKAASRRRRAAGGYGRFRAEVRRRRLKERFFLALSTMAVLAVTGLFYLLLSR
jgi:hypothetical protein